MMMMTFMEVSSDVFLILHKSSYENLFQVIKKKKKLVFKKTNIA